MGSERGSELEIRRAVMGRKIGAVVLASGKGDVYKRQPRSGDRGRRGGREGIVGGCRPQENQPYHEIISLTVWKIVL